jgi:hypothetical protein
MFYTPPSLFDPPTYPRKKPLQPAEQPEEADAPQEVRLQQPPLQLQQRHQSAPQEQTLVQRNAAPLGQPPDRPDEQQNFHDPAESRIPSNTTPFRPKDAQSGYLRRLTELGQLPGALPKILQPRPGPMAAATPQSTAVPTPAAERPLPATAAPPPSVKETPPVAQAAAQLENARKAGAVIEGGKMIPHPDGQGGLLHHTGFALTSLRDHPVAGTSVPYRDDRGMQHQIPVQSMRRITDANGRTNYHFMVGGKPVSVPEGATPLFRIDHDGRRYTQTPDDTRRELGYDRMAAARAGIAPREAAARKALDQTLARGAEHYGGFIEEYRRRQADIHQYKTAASETPQDSEWQKTARSAQGDPRTWDTQLIAEVEKRDPAKAAAMRQALLPQPTKRLFDAAEKSFAGASAAGGQPAAEASDSVPEKSMTLHEMLMQAPAMMQGQSGDQPPADLAAAARSTAQHALGISDPENVRVTRSADGTYPLSRPAADGSGTLQPFAILDPETNRLTLSPGPDGQHGQAAISMAAKGSPHGIPIYLPGTQPPLSEAERSELIAKGLHATSTTTDRQQADAALTQAGLSPQGIRQLVNEGRLSVQDGQFLNDKFNGGREAQANTTQPPSPQGFAAWVTDQSNPRSAWWRNGTDEQKAVAVHEYYDALAAGRMGDGHTTPEGIENLRRQALGDIRPEWGKPGTTTPGQARQTGAARFESIPLKDGGQTLLPGGKWTVEDLEKLHENPVFAKATQTERDAVMNHVIGQSFTDYSHRPGFDQAAYQRFNQIAQQARDRSAALKTWSDTGSDALNFGGNVVGGVVRPVIATATDSSLVDPDNEWRVPFGNVAEQAGYWGQKAKDTLHGFLPAARAANSKLGSELESLHQDLINGNFPLNDRTKLDEWLAARSKGLTDSQKAWYEAVQGKPDTSTDKGLSQHIYTHANSLLNPANAELVSKFIQTRDPAVWDELHRNLTRTPQRAETEQAQQKSLEESKIVNFMTQNYGGGDYAEHMQSAGNPIDIASNLLPMVRGLRAGKAAAEAAVLAGKATAKGSAAALAKSAALNLGIGGVQTLVENPDATFADLAQAGKENIATALGLHAVGHVAGKAKAFVVDKGKVDASQPPSTPPDTQGSGSTPTQTSGAGTGEDSVPPSPKDATDQPKPEQPLSKLPEAAENSKALDGISRLKEKAEAGELSPEEKLELDQHEKTRAATRVYHLETEQQALSKLNPPRELDRVKAQALEDERAILERPVPGEPPAGPPSAPSESTPSKSIKSSSTDTNQKVTPPNAGAGAQGADISTVNVNAPGPRFQEKNPELLEKHRKNLESRRSAPRNTQAEAALLKEPDDRVRNAKPSLDALHRHNDAGALVKTESLGRKQSGEDGKQGNGGTSPGSLNEANLLVAPDGNAAVHKPDEASRRKKFVPALSPRPPATEKWLPRRSRRR